jgi:excisionase family DNA binding protein
MIVRFLTRGQVAEELGVSEAQVYALIRRQDLRALKIGGRGTWRIGREDLEAYIERTYAETARRIEIIPSLKVRMRAMQPPDSDPFGSCGWPG